ncbi:MULTISPECIES: phosphatase PAP2 family protein [unclassified Crossiella]|uniref:phosphatase PAP2 family protein n=1 Tax=unclassified Crossiella TaxID=2620835 RepID=UPI001FFF6DF9|nr:MULTISPECIES: phosphatase PAP2 family protein [unclassified Crossiella]MCK2237532.1 phosphatase PAP2 family protein [Crossiella sp. S99.2]MCK2254818.1 phosphatase PAP2 family protein [Crossiella sp. S99.1]
MKLERLAVQGIQRALSDQRAITAAKVLSGFGEHAAGWLALGAAGAALDRRRRPQWIVATAGVALAHAASIAVKRAVRRPRPDHPEIEVRTGTPSQLSFPSAHATSSTAAAVLLGGLAGRQATPVLLSAVVPPMALSRLVLGVHYPSDVLAGAALGAAVGAGVRSAMGLLR